MQTQNYLVKNRFHIFYYRHITPPDIRKLLPAAKLEVRFSLQTKELKTALPKARFHRVQFELFFETIRKLQVLMESAHSEMALLCEKESEKLQKFSEQINLLFEKRNRIKNIFTNFPRLKQSSIKDISFKTHHDINAFIAIVDKLNDPKTVDHDKYIDKINFKSTYINSINESRHYEDGNYRALKIEKLPIVIKPNITEPFQSKSQVSSFVENEKAQLLESVTDIIDKDEVDTHLSKLTHQSEEPQTVTLSNITVDNEHDMQNLMMLVNAIQNNDFAKATQLASNINTEPSTPKLKFRISDVFNDYLIEKERHWSPKTFTSNKAILDLFLSAMKDLYVDQLTDDHARHWIDVIQRMPANRNKMPQFKNMSVDEILEISHTFEPVSIQTSKDYLQVSKAAFRWAKQRKYLPYTFMKDMLISAKKKKISKESEERRIFSSEDLVNIFTLPRFTQGEYTRTYYCWFPLLGLYSGARGEELAQMDIQDIYKEKNIWVLNINDYEEKKLKTVNSRRIIPVHKTLIKLGFIKYVEYLKLCFNTGVTATTKLFPELTKQRDGYGRKPLDRFISFLEQNNLKQDDQAFHSFRHTFADNMMQADIPEIYCAALIGHKHSNITYGRYAKEFAPSKTQKIINSINPLPDDVVKNIKPFTFPIEFKASTMNASFQKMVNKSKSWSKDKNAKKLFPHIFTEIHRSLLDE